MFCASSVEHKVGGCKFHHMLRNKIAVSGVLASKELVIVGGDLYF